MPIVPVLVIVPPVKGEAAVMEVIAGGVSICIQLPKVVGGVACKIKVWLMSVRTATSPTCAVKANIAACEATTKVSLMASGGSWLVGIKPDPSSEATPLTAPTEVVATAPKFVNAVEAVVAPVPPLVIATVPVTFAAVPVMLPEVKASVPDPAGNERLAAPCAVITEVPPPVEITLTALPAPVVMLPVVVMPPVPAEILPSEPEATLKLPNASNCTRAEAVEPLVVTGIAVTAPVPLPTTTCPEVSVVLPVPPLATATVPVTLEAVPVVF